MIGDHERNHAYNACKIDGQLYYMDVTWNPGNNNWVLLTAEEMRKRGRNIDTADVNWSMDIRGK